MPKSHDFLCMDTVEGRTSPTKVPLGDANRLLWSDHGSPVPAPVKMFPDAGRIRRL